MMKRFLRTLLFCVWLVPSVFATEAQAVGLEGVGHANIHNGDLEAARAEARRAAMAWSG